MDETSNNKISQRRGGKKEVKNDETLAKLH
jgi:hypothetical protein